MSITNATLYRYPLDPTGVSPDNLVFGEQHTLSNRTVRCIAPVYGGFFGEGLEVRNSINGTILIRGVDYKLGELMEFPTGRYGKEVWGVIVIYNTNLTQVTLRYQALGGDYSYSMTKIIEMIDNLDLSHRPAAWPDIIGKPASYPPASHLHDIGDVYGFEYVVHSIERLRTAILMGDTVSHDEIYRYVDKWGQSLQNYSVAVQNQLNAHEANKSNPHSVTKAQVGLGSVENLPLSTTAEAQEGVVHTSYMTPVRVKEAVASLVGNSLSTHISDMGNPHQTTKAQVGLGNVENYSVATQGDAQAGLSNTLYMTPLRVKEAVTALVGNNLDAHIADRNNPHGTTKAQVGLGSVENYPPSTQEQAISGSNSTSYMTPLTALQAIQKFALTSTNFTTDTSAPRFFTPAGNGGYNFSGLPDTRLGCLQDGTMLFLNLTGSNYILMNNTGGRRYMDFPLYTRAVGPAMAMAAGAWDNQGAFAIECSNGTGDWNMAGMQFLVNGGYAIRLGLRHDGFFGLGGASSAPWRWYSDPSGNMTASGDVVAYSDPILKENFRRLTNSSETLCALTGYAFSWKHGIEHTQLKAGRNDYGFSADDVERVLPYAVHSSIELDGQTYRTVAYSKILPVVVEAFKENFDKVEGVIETVDTVIEDVRALRLEIASLKERLASLH